jgi:hypothetical protein
MSEFSIICHAFNNGEEIPKHFGYKHGNDEPGINFADIPIETKTIALIMDDPDAMAAVGKVWVHWLQYWPVRTDIDGKLVYSHHDFKVGKNDFGESYYGGPAPPDKRHTYIFKAYALDTDLDLKERFSKQELENAMKGHILAEAKLTGTFAP